MEASLRLIGDEVGRNRAGGDWLIALKMSEVIFTQAIRTFLEREGDRYVGLAGFADPQISRALSAFHGDPAGEWSVEGLAREAGLSRTGFAVHFSSKMGMTPMQYLNQLADTDRVSGSGRRKAEHRRGRSARRICIGFRLQPGLQERNRHQPRRLSHGCLTQTARIVH